MNLLLFCLALAPQNSFAESERMPACGVACLYYVARSHGLDVTLQNVEAKCRSSYPSADLSKLSIEQIEVVGRALGLHFRAVKVDRSSIRQMPIPAILYIRSERLRGSTGDVGHMILLTGAGTDSARVFDPSTTESRVYPWDTFWSGYDGELLASIETELPVHNGFVWAAVLSGIAGGLVMLYWFYTTVCRTTSSSASGHANVLLLLLVFCATGCGAASMPPVSVDNSMQDLGSVTDVSELACHFHITVNDEKGVTIRSLVPSCSCISIHSNDLVGRALSRGTKEKITLTVRGRDMAGDLEGHVLVQTEPESPTPITFGFRAKILAGQWEVRSCPTNLLMRLNKTADFEVVIDRFRAAQTTNLNFDAERSVNPVYQILEHRMRENLLEAVNIQSKAAVRETHTFSVTAAPLSQVGETKSRLSICWREKDEKCVNIDITRAIEHPFRLRQASLFLGYLEPGQSRESFIAAFNPVVMQKQLREITSNDNRVSATYDQERGGIRIQVVAPSEVGRFRYVVALKCAVGEDFEQIPLELPVSGIVESR